MGRLPKTKEKTMNDTMNPRDPQAMSAEDARARLDVASGARLERRDDRRRYGLSLMASGVAIGALLAVTSMAQGVRWSTVLVGFVVVAMIWMDRWTKEAGVIPRGVKRRTNMAGVITVVVMMAVTMSFNYAFRGDTPFVWALIGAVATGLPFTIAGLATLRADR